MIGHPLSHVNNLIIPCINRGDLLLECLHSIDTQIDDVLVIDNSPWSDVTAVSSSTTVFDDGRIGNFNVVEAPQNMGVAASWNFGIRMMRKSRYWIISNADTKFGTGDLERLAYEVDTHTPQWVGVNGDWRVFGINQAAIDAVGFFDENFHPIYCEDADYEYRCRLAGVEYRFIDGATSHIGSVSWKGTQLGRLDNARTYPENLRYYGEKWGGHPRGGETYTSPFGKSNDVAYWKWDRERLSRLDWYRDDDMDRL